MKIKTVARTKLSVYKTNRRFWRGWVKEVRLVRGAGLGVLDKVDRVGFYLRDRLVLIWGLG